jgi:hypothetical protein
MIKMRIGLRIEPDRKRSTILAWTFTLLAILPLPYLLWSPHSPHSSLYRNMGTYFMFATPVLSLIGIFFGFRSRNIFGLIVIFIGIALILFLLIPLIIFGIGSS